MMVRTIDKKNNCEGIHPQFIYYFKYVTVFMDLLQLRLCRKKKVEKHWYTLFSFIYMIKIL